MKKTTLKKVSNKQSKLNREYLRAKKVYLALNSNCEVCGDPASEIHHKKGRGINLCNVKYFLATCLACHARIHRSAGWARDQGFMLDRIGKQ